MKSWWKRQSDTMKAAVLGLVGAAVLAPLVTFLLTSAAGQEQAPDVSATGRNQVTGAPRTPVLPALTPSRSTPVQTIPPLTQAPAPAAYPRVPLNLISRWRGTVGGDNGKFIVDLTVTQADLGSSVGPFSIDTSLGWCTFSTSLLDAGVDYIEVTVTLINGNCRGGVVRLQLQGDGTVYYVYERGVAKGVLMRYAS
jgi:hypothetical protein